jgi:CheY-like chemotaxis protein
MRILLVDDDENKRRQIADFIDSKNVFEEIVEARSLQSGLEAIGAGSYDLIVLDMTMPTFDITASEDGGPPLAFGGRELLRYMVRRNIRASSVVITQFDQFGEGHNILTLEELNKELERTNVNEYYGTIYFNVADESWKAKLNQVIEAVTRGKELT